LEYHFFFFNVLQLTSKFTLIHFKFPQIHLELGSGDGRVNFIAYDNYKVKKSTGIDVDEKILSVAMDRFSRRHPQPENLSFRKEDLLTSKEWLKDAQEATVITMYFITEALTQLRPLLEEAFKKSGTKRCRIVCCGYAMPGWTYQGIETILDLPIYMYLSDSLYHKSYNMDWAIVDDHRQCNYDPTFKFEEDDQETIQDDDIELIETPLFDPTEITDSDWDDFDDPPEPPK
jgi:hypothetical protein